MKKWIEEYNFFCNSSSKLNVFITELRKYYGLTIEEFLDIANVSKNVYDRLIWNLNISINNCLKIIFALNMHPAVALKFISLNHIPFYLINDMDFKIYTIIVLNYLSKEIDNLSEEYFKNNNL